LPGNQGTEATKSPRMPLAGRRIVVTRAAEQSRALTAQLTELGATVISLPTISFTEPLDAGPLDTAIGGISNYDWLLFTSANAVRFFAQRCRGLNVDPHALQSGAKPLFVAAVGPATSEAAAAAGFLVGHMAEEFQGKALATELGSELAGKKVLLPQSDLAASELAAELRAGGAEVTQVTAYRTLEADTAAPESVEAVRRGAVDVVSFFSGSSFQALAHRIGMEPLQRVAIAAIGPVTAGAIRSAGLMVAIEAPQATTAAFVAALVEYFSVGAGVAGKKE